MMTHKPLPNNDKTHSLHVLPQLRTLPDVPPTAETDFLLIVVFPHWTAAIIFCWWFWRPSQQHGVPLTRSASVVRLPRIPSIFHANFYLVVMCWIVTLRPRQPPLTLFFDPSLYAPPNEQINDSKCKPNGLQPAHGFGEQQCHDLMVPLLYPWREREKPQESMVAVAWVGCCCVCCVLCFVACVLPIL